MELTASNRFDEAIGVIRQFVDEHENEERPGNPGCLMCTEGTTPRHLETGPCAYHAAKRYLAKLSGGAR